MNQALYDLYMAGELSYEDALSKSPIPEELLSMMQRASTIGKGK
jgi:Tfp pilus assembly ATPase PilU